MDICGDFVCGFLTAVFDDIPYEFLEYTRLFSYTIIGTVSFALGTYYVEKRPDDEAREGFINGIMYYLNIQAYNDANIPFNIEEDAQEHVAEAKRRLRDKIIPRVPL